MKYYYLISGNHHVLYCDLTAPISRDRARRLLRRRGDGEKWQRGICRGLKKIDLAATSAREIGSGWRYLSLTVGIL